MLTIFANMKIDSTVRLQHMKDSFLSFDTISDNWLINIRGKFRNDALGFFLFQTQYLQQHLLPICVNLSLLHPFNCNQHFSLIFFYLCNRINKASNIVFNSYWENCFRFCIVYSIRCKPSHIPCLSYRAWIYY